MAALPNVSYGIWYLTNGHESYCEGVFCSVDVGKFVLLAKFKVDRFCSSSSHGLPSVSLRPPFNLVLQASIGWSKWRWDGVCCGLGLLRSSSRPQEKIGCEITGSFFAEPGRLKQSQASHCYKHSTLTTGRLFHKVRAVASESMAIPLARL